MTDTPVSNTSTLWQGPDIQAHVAVAQAEHDFSHIQQSLNASSVLDKVVQGSIDLEKGQAGDRQGTFDLREYLTSSNDANSAAGIKHKHVGVTWEELEVLGIGSQENKVQHFMNLLPSPLSHCLHLTDLRIYIRRCGIFIIFLSFFPDASDRCNCRICHFSSRSPSRCPSANFSNKTVAATACPKDHLQVGLREKMCHRHVF